MLGESTLSASEPSLMPPASRPRVLEFTGRLTFGAENEKSYGELRRYVELGEKTFIFDLGSVTDMDSAGVGFLVTCFTTVLRGGGELRLAAPNDRVLYVLLITRLDTVFPVFESVEAALAA